MQSYSAFIIDSYAFDPPSGVVSLRYSFDDAVHFEERIAFPTPFATFDAATLDRALFGLHLMCGISYFKAALPKVIDVRSGTLTKDQSTHWNTVYTKGLGEFFYKNEIDFRDLIHFPMNVPTAIAPTRTMTKNNKRVLVPFGGGKDSFVTATMLQEEGKDVTLLRVGAHPFIDAAISAIKLPCITVNRTISPELITLNEAGALNGHIPITAIVSWISVVAGILYDINEIAMSNEKSANVGNAVLHGMEVNHQWSKGLEYEQMMAAYVKQYVDPSLTYRSALREFTELQIAKIFCAMPQYLPLAVSCNRNWSLTKGPAKERWCGTCPKCAFIFLLYGAFLPEASVIELFGRNLFEEEVLLPTYRELLGITGVKPFECVGTPEETREAFQHILTAGKFRGTRAMKLFQEEATRA